MTNLRKLFQIQKPNYKEIINEDKMRCELSKIEDIKFIEKLIAGENLVMIGKDKAFDMRVENAEKRMESFF